ncbi:MAG: hypothetical protein U5K53_02780 [Halanaerobiales bacterium]|nr:hypothetical protein [Halanaerobiales bacterium]
MKELKKEFEKLSEDEKLDFAKKIMPDVCKIIINNPQKMQEMMSECKGMMDENMDMSQMMGMMKNMMDK